MCNRRPSFCLFENTRSHRRRCLSPADARLRWESRDGKRASTLDACHKRKVDCGWCGSVAIPLPAPHSWKHRSLSLARTQLTRIQHQSSSRQKASSSRRTCFYFFLFSPLSFLPFCYHVRRIPRTPFSPPELLAPLPRADDQTAIGRQAYFPTGASPCALGMKHVPLRRLLAFSHFSARKEAEPFVPGRHTPHPRHGQLQNRRLSRCSLCHLARINNTPSHH